MQRFFTLFLDSAMAAVILAPVFWLLDKGYFRNSRKTFFYWIFAVYLSAIFAATGIPTVVYFRFDPNFNFDPFKGMLFDWKNSLLNVLFFMPLGFFLPVFWKAFKHPLPTLSFAFFASLLIEVLQLFSLRFTDVNDLMTNTFGALLGWVLARVLLPNARWIRPGWKTEEVYWLFGLSFAGMFFLYPFLSQLVYSIIL